MVREYSFYMICFSSVVFVILSLYYKETDEVHIQVALLANSLYCLYSDERYDQHFMTTSINRYSLKTVECTLVFLNIAFTCVTEQIELNCFHFSEFCFCKCH
jgi:hypothetical protein